MVTPRTRSSATLTFRSRHFSGEAALARVSGKAPVSALMEEAIESPEMGNYSRLSQPALFASRSLPSNTVLPKELCVVPAARGSRWLSRQNVMPRRQRYPSWKTILEPVAFWLCRCVRKQMKRSSGWFCLNTKPRSTPRSPRKQMFKSQGVSRAQLPAAALDFSLSFLPNAISKIRIDPICV